MTPSRPPKLATWLLKHFGCSDNNGDVMGDLAERYQQGKNSLWYWRQVLIAILVSAFNEIRNHPLLNLRAALLGWILLRYVLLVPAAVILGGIGEAFAADAWKRREFTASWYVFIGFALAALSAIGIASGWIVAVLHARRRTAILFHAATVLLFWVSINPQGKGIERLLFWTNIMGITVGILIGGLLLAGRCNSESETA